MTPRVDACRKKLEQIHVEDDRISARSRGKDSDTRTGLIRLIEESMRKIANASIELAEALCEESSTNPNTLGEAAGRCRDAWNYYSRLIDDHGRYDLSNELAEVYHRSTSIYMQLAFAHAHVGRTRPDFGIVDGLYEKAIAAASDGKKPYYWQLRQEFRQQTGFSS